MSDAITLTMQEITPDFAAALWDDFLILEWRRAIKLESLQRFERFSQRVVARLSTQPQHAGRGLFTIVNSESAVPETSVREAMAEGMQRNASQTRSIALVYEATGLHATVLRSIASAVTLMSRQKAPTRVFSTVDDACKWQTEFHGHKDKAAHMQTAVALLRSLTP